MSRPQRSTAGGKRSWQGKPQRLAHPRAGGMRAATGAPAAAPASPAVPAGTPNATAKPGGVAGDAVRAPQLDGAGKRYITLAQFLKREQFAETGGAAKHLARSGAAAVNGEAEARPGRKLHDGDQVAVAGRTLQVVVDPPLAAPGGAGPAGSPAASAADAADAPDAADASE